MTLFARISDSGVTEEESKAGSEAVEEDDDEDGEGRRASKLHRRVGSTLRSNVQSSNVAPPGGYGALGSTSLWPSRKYSSRRRALHGKQLWDGGRAGEAVGSGAMGVHS